MYSRLERLQRPTFYIFSAKLAKLINIIKKNRNFMLYSCYILFDAPLPQSPHLFQNTRINTPRGRFFTHFQIMQFVIITSVF
jgi:hypothetical protein